MYSGLHLTYPRDRRRALDRERDAPAQREWQFDADGAPGGAQPAHPDMTLPLAIHQPCQPPRMQGASTCPGCLPGLAPPMTAAPHTQPAAFVAWNAVQSGIPVETAAPAALPGRTDPHPAAGPPPAEEALPLRGSQRLQDQDLTPTRRSPTRRGSGNPWQPDPRVQQQAAGQTAEPAAADDHALPLRRASSDRLAKRGR